MSDPHETLELGSARGRWVLAITVLGSALGFLDATVVNVALPQIARELDTDVADVQWIVTGYSLSLAALLLLGGAFGDRYRRRRVFVLGVAWFTASSLLCAVAPTVELLVATRILQGVGAALVTPGSLAIIQASFRPDERPKGPSQPGAGASRVGREVTQGEGYAGDRVVRGLLSAPRTPRLLHAQPSQPAPRSVLIRGRAPLGDHGQDHGRVVQADAVRWPTFQPAQMAQSSPGADSLVVAGSSTSPRRA